MPDTSLADYPFELVEERYDVGGVGVRLVRPDEPHSVIEAFLEPDELGPDPFSSSVWPSAVALAGRCARAARAGALPSPVLDLGTGLGLTAIALALGGADVVATDASPFALALVRESAARNGVGERVRTRVHRWGAGLGERFALVVGADLLYEPGSHAALRATLGDALAPGGSVWLSDPHRPASAAFLASLGEAWRVRTSPLADGVRLHELRRV